ncbi:iron ABC transporter permease [Sulfitobacter mediterraneus]|uniref:ABC transporter permease n=1 Tax=Sulfitobacter mediterraneus TaxID=83219 RepID=UPI001939E3B4|nr:iron ABC transporter permease [Sulfitobacter mediterraneus]MBM1555030.1 iron ABC transporter permease [Sulfitobacter mediterraneus]MBM1567417.1 iron ABC transporter permease [Sulfitobacter mediterraneus]MBM1571219.1 iron ABC transporter permease [Sulfitobacter mediterraneus]MBM1575019.1 iron ABC transporter permease [Sulfitobacter mediterraneus]MBM1577988.1 iron ABC transporter permease [Sulfitobacter mediterraneus]
MTLNPAQTPTKTAPRDGIRVLSFVSVSVAVVCALPMLAVLIAALSGGTETVQHLIDTVLGRYAATTLLLVLLVSIGTFAIGVGAAWLVTMTRFPGVKILEIALVLPLAFPAYVLAYAYTHVLDHPGIVQATLRDVTGWGPRDYWFPEIRSLGGAAAMLVLVLYPYVYLLARAAFLQQSGTTFLAARALGSSAWAAFFKVSLPLARPAIAGGVLLAVMETIADFGTVAYFGVQTFATGIYTSWFSMFDRAGAAQLALCLLSFALLLALLERVQRGRAKYHDPSRRSQAMPPIQLKGGGAAAAMIVCGIPVVFGAVLPIGVLLVMGLGSEQNLFSPRYLGFIQNSVTLAGIAAVVTVCAAISVGFFQRLRPGRLSNGSAYVARLGYAVPGGVIAVGLLVPFAAFDNAFDAWMRATFDISTGLLITGSIWLLIAAYLVRFLAAALGAYEGGQAMVHANMDAAARSLGQTPLGTLRRVHLPILAPSLLTALLIVFVDVMKELPATLIMRPFNYDTLAVQAYRLASDERLEGAAVPSLVIVAMGLLPVILICRQVGRKR